MSDLDHLDHLDVTATVLQLETLTAGSMGRTTHLAVCEVSWAGLDFAIHGIRLERGPDGAARVCPPAWRHPSTGRWHTALTLPDVLQAAIADAVIEAVQGAAGRAPGGRGAVPHPPDPRASGEHPCGPAAATAGAGEG